MSIFLFALIILFITFGITFIYSCILTKFKNIDKEISYPCFLVFTALSGIIFIVTYNYYAPNSDAENKIEAKYQNSLNSLNNEIENYIRQHYSSEFDKAYKSENCFDDFQESVRLKQMRNTIRHMLSRRVNIKFNDICLKRDALAQTNEYCFCKWEALSIVENSIATIENELRAKPEIVAIYKLAEKDTVVLSLKKKIYDLGKLREEERNAVAKKREIWTIKNFILIHIGFAILLFIILFTYNKLHTIREKNWRRKQNVKNFIENIR